MDSLIASAARKRPSGPSDYTWKTSPGNVAFMQAMAEREGGMEAAQEIWERYLSYVAKTRATLTRTREQP